MLAGVVITKDAVDTYVPLYLNEGNTATEYTMTTLEELGLLKMDFLGLRTLTVIEDCIDLVKKNRGINVKFDEEMNDPNVYKLWQEGKTYGIFQFESSGMTSFMKELKPDCLEDLIAGVSLYRPGPMDQIPRYIKGKQNPGHNEYTHPALEPILNVTYGCMVYQEQVMQIVRDLAGYSLGRADLVRRAMGKKKLDVMAKEREIFINGQVDDNGNILIPGCVRNGIDENSSNKIFDEMSEFAKYAFNKSHAACYAVVAYRTAYLKAYYKEEFMAATLNSFLGNLDKIPVYIEECKNLGIEILKPSINESYAKFTVKDGKIRYGMGSIKNVGTAVIDDIVSERNKNGKFESFTDFCERVSDLSVNKKCIESLIKSGCFDDFGKTRSTLTASFEDIIDTINSAKKEKMENQVSVFDLMNTSGEEKENKQYIFHELDEFDDTDYLSMEKEMLGIYLSGHPLEKFKNKIKRNTNINSLEIAEIDTELQETGKLKKHKEDEFVKCAGIISKVKKKITKNNSVMAFVTIDDLYGSYEVIVFESIYNKCSYSIEEEKIVLVDGRLSIREDEPTKIIATNIKEMVSEDTGISKININITDFSEEDKEKLRNFIRYYSKQTNPETKVEVTVNTEIRDCGNIFIDDEILKKLYEMFGEDNIKVI